MPMTRRNLKAVKVKTGIAVGVLALTLNGCAWFESEINKPCPDPNSCTCPTSTNPACPQFPQDAKKPDGGQS
jgi:hypothetical protein